MWTGGAGDQTTDRSLVNDPLLLLSRSRPNKPSEWVCLHKLSLLIHWYTSIYKVGLSWFCLYCWSWRWSVIFPPVCTKHPTSLSSLFMLFSYFMPQQLNGQQLICCRLQKHLVSGFSSNVTCCILIEEETSRGECESSLFTSHHSTFPPVQKAPSKWPPTALQGTVSLAVGLGNLSLLLLVTSDYFSFLFRATQYKPVLCCMWEGRSLLVSMRMWTCNSLLILHSPLAVEADAIYFIWKRIMG